MCMCVCTLSGGFSHKQVTGKNYHPPFPTPTKKERKKKGGGGKKEVNIKFNNVPERNLHDNQVWDPRSPPLPTPQTESGVSPTTLSQAHNNISLLNSALQRCLGPPPSPPPPPPSSISSTARILLT